MGIRRKLTLHQSVIAKLFSEGEHHYKIMQDAIPPDARILDVHLGIGSVDLIVESNQWHPSAPYDTNIVMVDIVQPPKVDNKPQEKKQWKKNTVMSLSKKMEKQKK